MGERVNPKINIFQIIFLLKLKTDDFQICKVCSVKYELLASFVELSSLIQVLWKELPEGRLGETLAVV